MGVVILLNNLVSYRQLKQNISYISAIEYGVKADGKTDNTEIIENLINNGYTNLYFPNGTYLFNISITKNNISFLGESKIGTIFTPYSDEKAVIELNSTNGNISNSCFSNFTIYNNASFINTEGIAFIGTNENDRHIFKDIIVQNGFKYGIHMEGRCIWSIFENFWIENCDIGLILNGSGVKNLLTFNNIYIRNCKYSGLVLDGSTDTFKTISFNNCNFENNCRNTTQTIQYAIKLSNFDEISFINCYIENNSNGTSTTYAIYCDGTYNRCLNILSSLIWGQEYGIYIKGVIMSGTINGNRLINSIDDIMIGTNSNNGGGHEESGFVLGGNTLSHPVTKVHDINMNVSITTLNPLSLAYRHANNNPTPNVKNCNIIMSWTNEQITNFLNGTSGQIVIVRVYGNGSKVFENGTYIQLRDSNSVTVKANECIAFMYFESKWVEIFRNVS